MTTVKVHGREMTFSEEELRCILEDYFSPTPTQGKWFEVNPSAIDQEIFDFERKDKNQEQARQIILDAFVELKNDPKYAKSFRTKFPPKNWKTKTVDELKELANENGCHIADWVEQALEWAQRIANGELWENICNNPDTSNWYRLVLSKYKNHKLLVGGSVEMEANCSSTDVQQFDEQCYSKLNYTVPLIVRYK